MFGSLVPHCWDRLVGILEPGNDPGFNVLLAVKRLRRNQDRDGWGEVRNRCPDDSRSRRRMSVSGISSCVGRQLPGTIGRIVYWSAYYWGDLVVDPGFRDWTVSSEGREEKKASCLGVEF